MFSIYATACTYLHTRAIPGGRNPSLSIIGTRDKHNKINSYYENIHYNVLKILSENEIKVYLVNIVVMHLN